MKAYRDQHFLTDRNAIERIADLVPVDGKQVLEIGPGNGALTRALLDRGAFVKAIELDYNLCGELAAVFPDEIADGRLEIIQGDAVKCAYPPCGIVISNLPYSASSKITFRLFEHGFDVAVLMYQMEFVKRMVAPTGTPACGRLSVMVQTFSCVERCFDLSPNCFSPKPQVRSTVVKIHPRPPIFPIRDMRIYADIVRVLFMHRRKTVRNCLRESGGILTSEQVEVLLAGLPEEIHASRPETLYLEDYATMANLVA